MNPVGLIYFVLIVLALIVGVMGFRLFFKRVRCLVSIRRLCRKKGLIFRACHPLWFLGSRYWKGCDCLIEGAEEIIAVKCFGCFWPLKKLVFREHGEYFFRAHSTFLKPLLEIFDGYPHALPAYRFPAPGEKRQRNMLLINPSPLDMCLQPSSGVERVTGAGDLLRGMELASLPHLLRIADGLAK